MNWKEFLKQEIETSQKAVLGLLEKVDESKLDWKPQSGNNWMTVGQLLKHMGEACGYGCRAFITGDWTLPDGRKMDELPAEQMMPSAEMLPSVASVNEAREILAKDLNIALAMIDRTTEEEFAHRLVAAPWAPQIEQPLGWMIHQMVEHLNQHKGQLFYYLKLQGKPVTTADLWGSF